MYTAKYRLKKFIKRSRTKRSVDDVSTKKKKNNELQFPGTNITIEKGTPVYVALCGLHTDSRYHPNPESFDPERFNDERKNDIVHCTYIPFGDGPRNCVGKANQVQLRDFVKNFSLLAWHVGSF